jgi:Co/Zn/Cd efflux system component
MTGQIIKALEEEDNVVIQDLHVWRMGPGHHGCIIALETNGHRRSTDYKTRLRHIPDLSHVTIEMNRSDPACDMDAGRS